MHLYVLKLKQGYDVYLKVEIAIDYKMGRHNALNAKKLCSFLARKFDNFQQNLILLKEWILD